MVLVVEGTVDTHGAGIGLPLRRRAGADAKRGKEARGLEVLCRLANRGSSFGKAAMYRPEYLPISF